MASQEFLLCKQSSIAFVWDCQIEGDIFNAIGILWYKYEALPKYGSILQYFFELSDNLNEWNASFKSNTDSTSPQELPSTENVPLSKGYARLFSAILMFRCQKSMTTLLSWVTFVLINMTGARVSWKAFFQYA